MSQPKATAVHRPTDPASTPTALLGSRPAYHLLSLSLFPLSETCARDQGPCQQFCLRTDLHPTPPPGEAVLRGGLDYRDA